MNCLRGPGRVVDEGRVCVQTAGEWTAQLQGRPRPPSPVRTEAPGVPWHRGSWVSYSVRRKAAKEFPVSINQRASELSVS